MKLQYLFILSMFAPNLVHAKIDSNQVRLLSKDRAIIDAGLKAIFMDHGMSKVTSLKGVKLTELNEDHGRLVLDDDSQELIKVEDKLEIMPTHGCTTIPLFEYIVIKEDVAVDKPEIIS
jgi:D-serine deaminase-like pyridoxal phosphate-dependent protein